MSTENKINTLVNQNRNKKLASNLPPDPNTIQQSHFGQQITHINNIPSGLPKAPSYYGINIFNACQQIQSKNTLSIPSPIQIGSITNPNTCKYLLSNSLSPTPISLNSNQSYTMTQHANDTNETIKSKLHNVVSISKSVNDSNHNPTQKEHKDEMEDDNDQINVIPLPTLNKISGSTSATNLISKSVIGHGLISLNTKHKSCPPSCTGPCRRLATCCLYEYDPGYLIRAQGCIIIPKWFTEKIIPNVIIENIKNVYNFMDKLTAINYYDGNYYDDGHIKIFNYGFHNKLGEELYCVVDQINKPTNRNYKYLMRDKLFTKKDILFADGLTYLKTSDLPKTSHGLNPMLKKHMDKIYDILSDEQCFSEQVMCNRNTQVGRKWHKINVFSTMNKKQLTQFNKKRFTLSMTPKEFINEVKQFMSGDDKVSLIPIIMFNCNGYRFEYIHIVKLRDNIDIGISFVYDEKYGLNVSGIHCNRDNIIAQHQLVLNHDCHCLDIFQSGINFLHIGNPDDDKNRYQAVKKENTRLKTENNLLKQQIKNMCDVQNENQRLKEKINNLEQQQLLSCSNGVSSPAILWYNYATPVITPTIYTPGTSMPSHYITPSTNNSMPIGFPNVQINNQMINSNLNCLSQLNNANNNQGITNNINTCLPFTINGNIKQ
eukprot:320994_1